MIWHDLTPNRVSPCQILADLKAVNGFGAAEPVVPQSLEAPQVSGGNWATHDWAPTACQGDESAAHELAAADLKVSATVLPRIPAAGADAEIGVSVIVCRR